MLSSLSILTQLPYPFSDAERFRLSLMADEGLTIIACGTVNWELDRHGGYFRVTSQISGDTLSVYGDKTRGYATLMQDLDDFEVELERSGVLPARAFYAYTLDPGGLLSFSTFYQF